MSTEKAQRHGDGEGISLVTGAGGFLGGHLVRCLVRNGIRVRASDLSRRPPPSLEGEGVEWIGADVTAAETLPPLFEGKVDRVFHLAAICNLSTPYTRLNPVNVQGVERITQLALEARVRSFVYMGSTSVYGPFVGVPFTETSPRHPQDAYGRSKRDGEDVVWQRIEKGLSAIVLRPCTVYGPGCTDGAGKVFSRPSAIAAIPGDGKQRLSNVRAEDVAGAALHLSRQENARGQAFNVAEDSHPTLELALALTAEAFGTNPPRIHLPVSLVAGAAWLAGGVARVSGRIPDLEFDAVRYLRDDYLVDNGRLRSSGYRLIHPDFAESVHELGRRHRRETDA